MEPLWVNKTGLKQITLRYIVLFCKIFLSKSYVFYAQNSAGAYRLLEEGGKVFGTFAGIILRFASMYRIGF